jgi:photosystem II stability/assembly factor-like uncharacterized protein
MNGLIGTRSGAYKLEGISIRLLGLENDRVSAIHATINGSGKQRILAGTYERGLFISDDDGASWTDVSNGFTAVCVRCIGPDPLNAGHLIAGTEPGRIFRSGDAGNSWVELDGIRDIEGHEKWFLPYSPRAGAVRNIYTPPGERRYLASVEVGGLLESRDNGKTWTCDPVCVDTDIHFVTGNPKEPAHLWAALGYAGLDGSPNPDGQGHRGGIARSRDGGQTWEKLFGDYTRAVIVPSKNPGIVIAAPAPEVGRHGRIESSSDGGDTWEDSSDGLETPMPDMVEEFVEAPDGSILAICSGGRLLRSYPEEICWETVLDESSGVNVGAIAFFD